MKKSTSFFLLVIMLNFTYLLSAQEKQKTLYDFKVTAIDGKPFDLASLKGKKVLIVNTASECGYTPQYADLEKLYKEFGSDKFTIIGFPSNEFGGQEPGTNSEIKSFCTKNYGVTFQMMEKISVKGDSAAPIYQWLTTKQLNGVCDAPVKWNFQKFMVDEKGHLVDFAPSKVKPYDDKIVNWIKGK